MKKSRNEKALSLVFTGLCVLSVAILVYVLVGFALLPFGVDILYEDQDQVNMTENHKYTAHHAKYSEYKYEIEARSWNGWYLGLVGLWYSDIEPEILTDTKMIRINGLVLERGFRNGDNILKRLCLDQEKWGLKVIINPLHGKIKYRNDSPLGDDGIGSIKKRI